MSHKIKIYIISTGLLLFGFMQLSIADPGAFLGSSAFAAIDPQADPGGGPPSGQPPVAPKTDADCPSQHVDPSDSSKCLPLGNDCPKGQTAQDAKICLKNNPITATINDAILILSGAVGVVVIGTIILGGIQYSMAGGSANSTQAAKTRITNGLIALLAFIFIAAFLQWLIPGGL